MKNKQLENIYGSPKLPQQIKNKIKEVLQEDEAYAADELVELCEEILTQLAAMGFAAYLSQPHQKEVYNDFIIQLFTSKSHAYNAGPLYRWAANMIKDLDDATSKKLYPLFWEEKEGELVLCEKVHQLAMLRNKVMHGFFLLPPEDNQKEATHLADVLGDIIQQDMFSLFSEASYHFLTSQSKLVAFKGNWRIAEEEWQSLENAHSFGSLSATIRYQLSEDFEKDQQQLVQDNHDAVKPLKVLYDFIKSNTKGAMAVWSRPNEEQTTDYANLVHHLQNDNEFMCVCQSLDTAGINFTSEFLLNRLARAIAEHTGTEKYSHDAKKALVQLRKECTARPVVVIHNVHTCLFHPAHLLHLADFFYENEIVIVAYGFHHPWVDQFFNQSHFIAGKPYLPSQKEWGSLFLNYLRFKGPSKEIDAQKKSFEELESVTSKLVAELKKEKQIVARRFADKHGYAMEYVHEAFSILHPFLNAERMKFKMDELDELYGFPKEITEASRLYFSIGRRDANLEYQHKILSV